MPDPRFDPSSELLPPEQVFEPETHAFSEVTDTPLAHDDDPQVHAVNSPGESLAPKLPGPGFWEACLWFVGFLVTHAIAAVVAAIVVLIWTLATSGINFGDRVAVEQLLQASLTQQGIGLILGEMLLFVVLAIGAGLLRTGRQPFRKLGRASLSPQHLVLIIGGAFPLMVFCGSLHHHLNTAWTALLEQVPTLRLFDTTNINTFMATLKDVPVPLLILAIAVCPAFGEEIIFRGVIGRGLTARYGVVVGILLTSCFFAFAHIHPAHSLAVLPLGIFLHVAYLATRSWIAPVLIHFINNAVAVGMMQVADKLAGNQLADDAAQPGWVMVVTGLIAFGTLVALWKSRIEYRDQFGDTWSPGYPTVEQPPERIAPVTVLRPVNPFLVSSAMAAGCLMTGVFVMGIVAAVIQDSLPQEPSEVVRDVAAPTADKN